MTRSRDSLPTPANPAVSPPPGDNRRRLIATSGLILAIAIATLSSWIADSNSVTYDETSHVAAGLSYWKTGDFRIAPDHPPLAKLWLTLPMVTFWRDAVDLHWPPSDDQSWTALNVMQFGRHTLFELNSGQGCVVSARLCMWPVLLYTIMIIAAASGRLFGFWSVPLTALIAALSPELIAHGSLATTDFPITCLMFLSIITTANLFEQFSWARLLLAAAIFAATTITKMSWPLLIPPLVIMWLVALICRRQPAQSESAGGTERSKPSATPPIQNKKPKIQNRIWLTPIVFALAAYVAIWSVYGGRVTIFPAPPPNMTAAEHDAYERSTEAASLLWTQALYGLRGDEPPTTVGRVLEFAYEHTLVPEPYLLGLAMTARSTASRPAYLMGEYSETGWWYYFPIAFALKTPIPMMILIALGLAAAIKHRRRLAPHALLVAGLVTFTLAYSAYAMTSNFNIGVRHLLPIQPTLCVLAGASALWWPIRWMRIPLVGCFAWLIVSLAVAMPDPLSYFNEFAGGPSNGWKYLADSNVDWGQDLNRLKHYADTHPGEDLKLAYFGTALPTKYVPNITALPSNLPFEPRATLTAGTYIVSVNQLLGVNDPRLRAATWDNPANLAEAQRMCATAVSAVATDNSSAVAKLDDLRVRILIARLSRRPPDGRIGRSMFVFRLRDAEVTTLSTP